MLHPKLFISFLLVIIGCRFANADLRADSEHALYYQLVDSADVQLRRENWSEGERLIKRALRVDPANPGNTLLFSNLGVAQMEQKKYPEAISSFDLALVRAPKSSTILANRAKVYLAVGNIERGMEDLDAVLQLDSVSEWGLQTRALLSLSRGGDTVKIRGDIELLKKHHPENPWGWYVSASLAEMDGDAEKAVKEWRRSYELEKDPEIAFRLSMSLLRREELPEAVRILRESLMNHPRDGKLMAAMGWYHRKSLLREESEADLKLARQYGAPEELLEWIRQQ